MIKIVRPANPETNRTFADWTMGKIGRKAVPPYRTLAAIEDERIVGGVVFNGYNGANVDITVYAPGGLTRNALREVFSFAFHDLKCTRVTARTRPGQAALIAGAPLTGPHGIFERIGFVREAVSARYYGNGRANDAIVYRMLRSECPWIGGEHGRARGTRPKRNRGRADANESRNRDHASGPQRR